MPKHAFYAKKPIVPHTKSNRSSKSTILPKKLDDIYDIINKTITTKGPKFDTLLKKKNNVKTPTKNT